MTGQKPAVILTHRPLPAASSPFGPSRKVSPGTCGTWKRHCPLIMNGQRNPTPFIYYCNQDRVGEFIRMTSVGSSVGLGLSRDTWGPDRDGKCGWSKGQENRVDEEGEVVVVESRWTRLHTKMELRSR